MTVRSATHAKSLRLPDDVYSETRSFLIDEKIRQLAAATGRSISLSPYWTKLGTDEAVDLGRRALARGYSAIIGPHDEHLKGEWTDQWRAGEKAALDAQEALRKLLRFMSPADASLSDPTFLAQVLDQQLRRDAPDLHYKKQREEARRRAGILIEARSIIETLPSFMARNRQQVATSRSNPGEPEKAAFLFQIGLAWAALTGRKPGRSPFPERNPFYRMVQTAWTDLGGGADTTFENAIRTLNAEGILQQATEPDGTPSDLEGWRTPPEIT